MKTYLLYILSFLLVLTSVFGLAGCNKGTIAEPSTETTVTEEPSPLTLRIGGLKGPTSMGMVKLLADAKEGKTENNYEFSMATAADELTPKLLKGELDALALPANVASILYNQSDGAVQTAAVSTLGVIYIVEKGENNVKKLADLKGKTVLATGKGTTPEYTLRYLLTKNGLNPDSDVTIEWKSEPTEVISQMITMDNAIAMMPQPFVTVAQNQLQDLHIAVDLTAEWKSLDNGSQCVTAVLLVRKDFADKYPDAVATFLTEYNVSTAYVNENLEEGAALIEKYNIVKAPIAKKAIPYCNLVCITGKEMKNILEGYYRVLLEQNPKIVGGLLPGEDFYFVYE